MSQARYYSSTATSTTLSGTITNADTTITVGSVTGFPASLPYTLILERDTANEEVVTVTAAAGTTLTVTRGADGTAAVSHTVGAKVEHGVSARDFNEPQAHIAASSAVHGLTGSVVGTSDAQTLTNKAINGATIDSASTIAAIAGSSIAGLFGAWQAFACGWSAGSTPTYSTNSGRMLSFGKTLLAYATVTLSSGATSGTLTFNAPQLPYGPANTVVGLWYATILGAAQWGVLLHNGTGLSVVLSNGSSNVVSSLASGDTLHAFLAFEAS